MTLGTLTFRYAIFAVIATIANLATQRAVLQVGITGANFIAAIGMGTIVGLIIKYALDKQWIFYDQDMGLKNNTRKFTLYTIMGVLTTLIFWGAETAFWLIWQTDRMREIGAIIGLAIGYIVKYNLDKRFVFNDKRKEVAL
ncbi:MULTISPECIES: GtrA family protein [unclassified Agrobacterium]|jgi:putative flippase GtrA|uniref:GtrA family protein n=1 Tax=unclassified Agrobacterium TaxID=2632611 RepID=UPI00244BED9D|nr:MULTISPECIES: GtrA family protein [unclassified Agrobacterium]MDH0617086.1 GtrA family protein [Agrobacterium sp. GD03872]MDH0699812.1 GtrA family protein [Agrobacterium sp. GD03871]MDH1062713.1 GtrA family protein [Agrobacterium sp. GD03992]MDH2214003.1 GtrA family protein [Agrobacterium sp. GD03643]MDH2222867.1 GtrA family protein [Agrobacterium sp. GD03638]